jgi:protocatechuate 3,4-dioxygenase beta subunit
MNPGVTVTGTLSIDGRALTAADGALSIQLQSASPGTPGQGAQRVQPDGTFTLSNVFPGRYRFRVIQAGKTPWVKSARWGADDVAMAPIVVEGEPAGRTLTVELSTKTASIDVAVLDAQRRPVSGVLVVGVPEAARRGRTSNYKSASTDAQGRVRFEDVAPGEYRIFATTDISLADWQDPDVLRRFETRGELVRLAEAGSASITVTVLR